MVDSEYSTNIYKSFNISTGTVMRNPEMSKFVSDDLKTKKMCKNVVKKLLFLIWYAPGRYKTHQICNKLIAENAGML